MEKLKMHSSNQTDANIARIRELFPNCVTEAKDEQGMVRYAVDFDQLRQELSEYVVEGPQERYQINWPGKREALLAANAPIAKTLRPLSEESLNFYETRNLFVEGNNLDALKLFQECYLGKVKLIYIDPPYNTGGDLIYEDDFSESSDQYLMRSNQKDEGGNRLFANVENNGRFHSDWLSLIYPRLKLARNLLANDGVIFVSIDDGESANLKRLLDEVFGEENFIDTIAVEMSTTSGPKTVNAQQGTIVKNVEFVHVYRKSEEFDRMRHTPLLDGVSSFDTHYSIWLNNDGTLGALVDELLADAPVRSEIQKYGFLERGKFSINNLEKLLLLSDVARSFVDANLKKIARIDRAPVSATGKSTRVGHWEGFEADHRTYFLTTLANGTLQALIPLSLNFRMSDDYKPRFGRTVIRGDLWKGFHQDMGNVAKEGGVAFPNGKKPVRLIKQLIKWANNTGDGIILDLFAGSGTTAHAVMQANAEDGGSRRFIMVQLDEVPDPKSEVAKAGFRTIAELSRERIRKAGKTIIGETGLSGTKLDVGFRTLKIDSSNMADVYYKPGETEQSDLLSQVDNVKPGRDNPDDLLFQVLTDWGVDLTLPISKKVVNGKTIYFVNAEPYDLVACFDGGISEGLVKELARYKPVRMVFRDNGFESDAVKINVEQIFRQLSPSTEVKAI